MSDDMRAKWLTYCKMTCVGGSEKGECHCKGSKDCELIEHPDYVTKRAEAIVRLRTMGPKPEKTFTN
jgi:hypothetical protein